jgi:flavin-binding protein dodecin
MKRYLVFAGTSYYASGGWLDFIGSAETLEEAAAEARRKTDADDCLDWHHIVDAETMTIVAGKDGRYCGVLPTCFQRSPD